jgi:hypothetical protein
MHERLDPAMPSLEAGGLAKVFHDGLADQHLVAILFTILGPSVDLPVIASDELNN